MIDIVPLNFDSHPIHAMVHDGTPFFLLSDVREAVGIKWWENIALGLGEHELGPVSS